MATLTESKSEILDKPIPKRSRRKAVSAEPLSSSQNANWVPKVIQKSADEEKRIQQVIGGCFLFGHLDKAERKVVSDAMDKRLVKAGEVVIKQGDDGDYFYIVDSGLCEIFVKGVGLVNTSKDGGSFGELALMYDAPRAATVQAKVDSVLWALDRETYKHIVMQSAISKRNTWEGFLKNVPILASLNNYDRLRIADALEEEKYFKGDVILREGDVGDSFYLIANGNVVCTQQYENKQGEVGRLKAGDYFGELALLTSKPRAATVTAVDDVTLLSLSRSTFDLLLGPLVDILNQYAEDYKSYLDLVREQAPPSS